MLPKIGQGVGPGGMPRALTTLTYWWRSVHRLGLRNTTTTDTANAKYDFVLRASVRASISLVSCIGLECGLCQVLRESSGVIYRDLDSQSLAKLVVFCKLRLHLCGSAQANSGEQSAVLVLK
jgi:hypothetical protein